MISASFAVEVKLSHVQEKRIAELKQEKWGKIIFSMAELHNLAGGPLDDFLGALAQLVSDLGDRVSELDEDFNQRSLFHQSEITRLDSEISDAQIDVSSAINLLENVLYTTRVALNNKIENYHYNIDENNKYVE